jgi:hypothetical protein
MSVPAVSIDAAAEELNRLHDSIAGKLRSTVEDAIHAGEILAEVKTRVGHGNFLPWLKLHCKFSERTARNYMQLFEHKDKTATLADLTAAYALVEQIEARPPRPRIEARVGSAEFQARVDAAFEAKKADYAERVADKPERDWSAETASVQAALNEQIAALETRASFKESIRLSHEGKDDPFVDAIMDYLDTLADDNRRIEACSNIIKVCRGIANQLQRASA